MDTQAEWSKYWQEDSPQGEVFVKQDGTSHPELADFWQKALIDITPGSAVLDMAAGAGSIFKHLPEQHGCKLAASDISEVALASLQKSWPQVEVIQASAEQMPQTDGSYDLIVSQFGLEYAGDGAFAEAARLLADNGRFEFLSHFKEGYIDHLNRAQYQAAQVIEDSNFIQLAIELTQAVFAENVEVFQQVSRSFMAAEQQMADVIKTQPQGVHSHLYMGFRQLYERRQNYHEKDILDWLNAMRDEVKRTLFRLEQMLQAAMDETRLKTIQASLVSQGINDFAYQAVQFQDHDKPVAWHISGSKS